MEEQQRRQRQHEGIKGEATLSALLPKGYTLLVIIVAGVFYAAMSYRDIIANAEDLTDVKTIQSIQESHIRILELNQKVIQEQFKAMEKAEQRRYDAAVRDRREIINAINGRSSNDAR